MSSERGTRRECLADGMGDSVDAVTGAAIGPYPTSRFKHGH